MLLRVLRVPGLSQGRKSCKLGPVCVIFELARCQGIRLLNQQLGEKHETLTRCDSAGRSGRSCRINVSKSAQAGCGWRSIPTASAETPDMRDKAVPAIDCRRRPISTTIPKASNGSTECLKPFER